MTDASQIMKSVDERHALDFLSQMARHKSYSKSDGERVLATWMNERMSGLGLSSELRPFDGDRVNAIGCWKGTGGGKSLMFNGHLDTNPVTEGWTVDPWGGLVDDRFIYGIGVSNMKAGCAAYFCAVKTLIDAGVKVRGDVLLTYVVGELQGGVGTHAMVGQGYRADYFVNSEPTDLQAMTMHAGAFVFTIELIGDTRHLSKREEAIDAIAAACDLIPRLNGMTFSGAASPEHQSVNRVNVGVVHGALGKELHEWRPPQVADYVRLRGSGRFAPGQSEAGAMQDMRAELAALEKRFPGLKTTIAGQADRLTMPAFEVSRDNPIVIAINNAYQKCRHEPQPTGVIKPPSFYGTDAGHLYEAGLPGIVCGPGGRYNTMPDERVDIGDYLDAVRIYAATILEICA
jgi:acetylornithine deacetylase